MFGNNAFGALDVEQASLSAGPSPRQVDGEEVDADVRSLFQRWLSRADICRTVAQTRQD